MRLKIIFPLLAAAVFCSWPQARAAGAADPAEEEQQTDDTAPKAQEPGGAQPADGGAGLQNGQPVSRTSPGGRSMSGAGSRGNSQPGAGAFVAAAQQGANKGLSSRIMTKASQVGGEINRSGGYRFDGRNDCYGFVRRTWDPELAAMRKPKLPVSDYVSRDWAPVTSWSALLPGDVLATHQGHMWGSNWHGGLFSGMVNGKPYSFDNSPSNRGGAYPRPAPAGLFRYYYLPTHRLLLGQGGKK